MFKRFTAVFVVGAVLGSILPAAGADELEQIEKKLTEAWKKHKSMTANFTMVTKMEQPSFSMESTAKGTQEMLRKGDQLLYRTDLTSATVQKMGDQETKTEQKMTMVCDGSIVYMLSEMMGQKMVVKSKPDAQAVGDPAATFNFLKKDYTLKILPEATVDGKKVYVIEATAKNPQPMSPTKMVYSFLEDDGALVKMVASDQAGKPMTTMTYSDIKFDVKIDPKHFEFEVPEDAQVMDQTGGQP